MVAEKTIAKLEKIAAPKRNCSETEQDEEDEVTEQQLAQWWLDYAISRKTCKRNCMTFPYGSKQRGFNYP